MSFISNEFNFSFKKEGTPCFYIQKSDGAALTLVKILCKPFPSRRYALEPQCLSYRKVGSEPFQKVTASTALMEFKGVKH